MTMRATLKALAHKPDAALVEYASPGEMFDVLNTSPVLSDTTREMQYSASFFSGMAWSDLAERVQQGDKATADKARGLLAKINAEMPQQVQRVRKSRPFGRAVVGAYLSSDPMPCRARVKVKTDTAPLTIAVNLVSSGMTDAGDLEKRGVAIAALVQRVSMSRPVKLLVCGAVHAQGCAPVAWVCEFPTRPLDAYRLAWVMANQGFARGMGFAASRDAKRIHAAAGGKSSNPTGASIRWLGDQTYSNDQGPGTYGADLAAFYGGDVYYIPAAGCFGSDYNEMLREPVAWINKTVAKLTAPDRP